MDFCDSGGLLRLWGTLETWETLETLETLGTLGNFGRLSDFEGLLRLWGTLETLGGLVGLWGTLGTLATLGSAAVTSAMTRDATAVPQVARNQTTTTMTTTFVDRSVAVADDSYSISVAKTTD